MLLIKTKTYIHRYDGNIEIYNDGTFIHINATSYTPRNENDLIIWDSIVFDMFYMDDILSIEGTDETAERSKVEQSDLY